MPIVPRALVDQNKIKEGVLRAEAVLAPDVVRIMYGFAENVMGEVSLFFKVVISDSAAAPAKLRSTTDRIVATILKEVKAEELGVQTYFNFRSRSEQRSLGDPSWERR